MARSLLVVAVLLASSSLAGCGPKKPPEGPPPEYEPGRDWTPDGKPVPRAGASTAPATSSAPTPTPPAAPPVAPAPAKPAT